MGAVLNRVDLERNGYYYSHYYRREYAAYYEAQALFQGDLPTWEKWNKLLVRQLKQQQQADGSFTGDFGPQVATSLSLLALALNYRFRCGRPTVDLLD